MTGSHTLSNLNINKSGGSSRGSKIKSGNNNMAAVENQNTSAVLKFLFPMESAYSSFSEQQQPSGGVKMIDLGASGGGGRSLLDPESSSNIGKFFLFAVDMTTQDGFLWGERLMTMPGQIRQCGQRMIMLNIATPDDLHIAGDQLGYMANMPTGTVAYYSMQFLQ